MLYGQTEVLLLRAAVETPARTRSFRHAKPAPQRKTLKNKRIDRKRRKGPAGGDACAGPTRFAVRRVYTYKSRASRTASHRGGAGRGNRSLNVEDGKETDIGYMRTKRPLKNGPA